MDTSNPPNTPLKIPHEIEELASLVEEQELSVPFYNKINSNHIK